MYLAILKAE